MSTMTHVLRSWKDDRQDREDGRIQGNDTRTMGGMMLRYGIGGMDPSHCPPNTVRVMMVRCSDAKTSAALLKNIEIVLRLDEHDSFGYFLHAEKQESPAHHTS